MNKKQSARTLTTTLLTIGSLVVGADASTIWNNGAFTPTNFGAYFSEGTNRVSDDFSITVGDTIRSIEFWGVHWSSGVEPTVELFTLAIYADAAGNPGALSASSNLTLVSKSDTGFDHNNSSGANILEFTMDLDSPINLSAGTYWLSVFSANNPGTDFAWQESGLDGAGNSRRSGDSGTSWFVSNNITSFNISNTAAIPEPSSTLILGIGVMGVIALRRRIK